MSTDVGTTCLNPYTPSHMDGGTPHARRQGTGMNKACGWAPSLRMRSEDASQADGGTVLRLAPHRERSME